MRQASDAYINSNFEFLLRAELRLIKTQILLIDC